MLVFGGVITFLFSMILVPSRSRGVGYHAAEASHSVVIIVIIAILGELNTLQRLLGSCSTASWLIQMLRNYEVRTHVQIYIYI